MQNVGQTQGKPRPLKDWLDAERCHGLGDTQLPSCNRCLLLKRECMRETPFPFRHSNLLYGSAESGERVPDSKAEFEFAEDQVWVTLPKNGE